MTDSIPDILDLLAAEARKAGNFETFASDFFDQKKTGYYWHLTENPNFQIDPTIGPTLVSEYETEISDPHIGKLMITSDLEHWAFCYSCASKHTRPYAALIDMSEVPREAYQQTGKIFGNEFWVEDPANAEVIALLQIEDALELDMYERTQLPKTLEELQHFYNSLPDVGQTTGAYRGWGIPGTRESIPLSWFAEAVEDYFNINFHSYRNYDIKPGYSTAQEKNGLYAYYNQGGLAPQIMLNGVDFPYCKHIRIALAYSLSQLETNPYIGEQDAEKLADKFAPLAEYGLEVETQINNTADYIVIRIEIPNSIELIIPENIAESGVADPAEATYADALYLTDNELAELRRAANNGWLLERAYLALQRAEDSDQYVIPDVYIQEFITFANNPYVREHLHLSPGLMHELDRFAAEHEDETSTVGLQDIGQGIPGTREAVSFSWFAKFFSNYLGIEFDSYEPWPTDEGYTYRGDTDGPLETILLDYDVRNRRVELLVSYHVAYASSHEHELNSKIGMLARQLREAAKQYNWEVGYRILGLNNWYSIIIQFPEHVQIILPENENDALEKTQGTLSGMDISESIQPESTLKPIYFDATKNPNDYADVYYGKNVTWVSNMGDKVAQIPAYYVTMMPGNIMDSNKLSKFYHIIKNQENPIFELPFADIYQIDLQDIIETQREYKKGHIDWYGMSEPWSTGNQELDEFIATPEGDYDDLFSPYSDEEYRQELIEELESLQPGNGDLGAYYAQVRDGNHRTFAAISAGEPYIYFRVSDHSVNVPQEILAFPNESKIDTVGLAPISETEVQQMKINKAISLTIYKWEDMLWQCRYLPDEDKMWPTPKNIPEAVASVEGFLPVDIVICGLVAIEMMQPFYKYFTTKIKKITLAGDDLLKQTIEMTNAWLNKEISSEEMITFREKMTDQVSLEDPYVGEATYAALSLIQLTYSENPIIDIKEVIQAATIFCVYSLNISDFEFLPIWWRLCRCKLNL